MGRRSGIAPDGRRRYPAAVRRRLGYYAPAREASPFDRNVRDREDECRPRAGRPGVQGRRHGRRVVRAATGRPAAVAGGRHPRPHGRRDAGVLFVAGCEENQARFHAQFDHIVLLSAPLETLVERLATRFNNPYGKAPEELRRFLDDVETVEPQLRRVATHEVRTTVPLNEVVTTILRLVEA